MTARTHTDDPELAREVIGQLYARYHPRIRGIGERTRFSLTSSAAGRVAVDSAVHSMEFDAVCDPLHQVTAACLNGGSVEIRRGGEELCFGPGDVVLYPSAAEFHVRLRGADQVLLRLDFGDIARVAAQHTDTDAEDFRLLGMRPVSPAMDQYWRSVITFAHRGLTAGPALIHPLILAQIETTLASAALSVFPNTIMTSAFPAPEGQVGPRALRRAVAYIDAHAGEAITAGDIAAGAGVGLRALHRAFADHRGTTPMGYLRRVRLERVHRDLQAADPGSGVTVAQIAHQWGFARPGRFAADYRVAYGVDPSKTLRT